MEYGASALKYENVGRRVVMREKGFCLHASLQTPVVLAVATTCLRGRLLPGRAAHVAVGQPRGGLPHLPRRKGRLRLLHLPGGPSNPGCLRRTTLPSAFPFQSMCEICRPLACLPTCLLQALHFYLYDTCPPPPYPRGHLPLSLPR